MKPLIRAPTEGRSEQPERAGTLAQDVDREVRELLKEAEEGSKDDSAWGGPRWDFHVKQYCSERKTTQALECWVGIPSHELLPNKILY